MGFNTAMVFAFSIGTIFGSGGVYFCVRCWLVDAEASRQRAWDRVDRLEYELCENADALRVEIERKNSDDIHNYTCSICQGRHLMGSVCPNKETSNDN